MPNWLSTMQQTFEYYIVDPGTWRDIKKVDNVTSSTINRDLNAETLGSASINISESLGECYIRIYLKQKNLICFKKNYKVELQLQKKI